MRSPVADETNSLAAPGFSSRAASVTKSQAVYTGLHGGHTYVVTFRGFDTAGKAVAGEQGRITFVTPR
jgi:hypothetical protein